MELYWLEYFQMIAKYGSVSKAAEKIHISQPAMSKTLSLLEQDLGVRLFDRTGRTITLNKFGASFLGNVNEILNRLEMAEMELNNMKSAMERRLVICINTGNRFLTNRMLEFINDHPDIRVEFLSKLVNPYDAEKCDVIVTYSSPMIPDEWKSVLLYEEDIVVLAAARNFPELEDSDTIALESCRDINFSLPERTARVDDLRDLYDEVFQKLGYVPKVIHQSVAVDQVRTQLLMNRCITLVPYGITTIMDMTGIRILKIRDCRLMREIRAFWSDRKPLLPEADSFIRYLRTSDFAFQLQELGEKASDDQK